jgi:hypothetical protein
MYKSPRYVCRLCTLVIMIKYLHVHSVEAFLHVHSVEAFAHRDFFAHLVIFSPIL